MTMRMMILLLLTLALLSSCTNEGSSADGSLHDMVTLDRLRVDAAQVIFAISWEKCTLTCQPRDFEILLIREQDKDGAKSYCILRQQRFTDVGETGQAILEAVNTEGEKNLLVGMRAFCPQETALNPQCPICTGHVQINPADQYYTLTMMPTLRLANLCNPLDAPIYASLVPCE